MSVAFKQHNWVRKEQTQSILPMEKPSLLQLMEPSPWFLNREYFKSRAQEGDGVLQSEREGRKFLVYIRTPVACNLL